MTNPLHLFLIVLCISIIFPAYGSATDPTVSPTRPASNRTHCHTEIDGFVLRKPGFYIWFAFTTFLCFCVALLTFVWIKDTVHLTNTVKELEKKVQDMEQYRVLTPAFIPQYVKTTPTKTEEKKTTVKVLNEVATSSTTPKVEPKKPEKVKQKTKKSAKKSSKPQEKLLPSTPSDTDKTKSTVSKESTQSTTVEKTSEDSKVISITKTVAEKETEEPSLPSSIATAEVLEISRKRY